MKDYKIILTADYQQSMGKAYRFGDYELIVESNKVPENIESRKAAQDDIELSKSQWPEDWKGERK